MRLSNLINRLLQILQIRKWNEITTGIILTFTTIFTHYNLKSTKELVSKEVYTRNTILCIVFSILLICLCFCVCFASVWVVRLTDLDLRKPILILANGNHHRKNDIDQFHRLHITYSRVCFVELLCLHLCLLIDRYKLSQSHINQYRPYLSFQCRNFIPI